MSLLTVPQEIFERIVTLLLSDCDNLEYGLDLRLVNDRFNTTILRLVVAHGRHIRHIRSRSNTCMLDRAAVTTRCTHSKFVPCSSASGPIVRNGLIFYQRLYILSKTVQENAYDNTHERDFFLRMQEASWDLAYAVEQLHLSSADLQTKSANTRVILETASYNDPGFLHAALCTSEAASAGLTFLLARSHSALSEPVSADEESGVPMALRSNFEYWSQPASFWTITTACYFGNLPLLRWVIERSHSDPAKEPSLRAAYVLASLAKGHIAVLRYLLDVFSSSLSNDGLVRVIVAAMYLKQWEMLDMLMLPLNNDKHRKGSICSQVIKWVTAPRPACPHYTSAFLMILEACPEVQESDLEVMLRNQIRAGVPKLVDLILTKYSYHFRRSLRDYFAIDGHNTAFAVAALHSDTRLVRHLLQLKYCQESDMYRGTRSTETIARHVDNFEILTLIWSWFNSRHMFGFTTKLREASTFTALLPELDRLYAKEFPPVERDAMEDPDRFERYLQGRRARYAEILRPGIMLLRVPNVRRLLELGAKELLEKSFVAIVPWTIRRANEGKFQQIKQLLIQYGLDPETALRTTLAGEYSKFEEQLEQVL